LKLLELLRIIEVPFPIVLFLIISHPIASIASIAPFAPFAFVKSSPVPGTKSTFSPRVKGLNIFVCSLREILIPKAVFEMIVWSYFRRGQNYPQRVRVWLLALVSSKLVKENEPKGNP
jgi:hypothetical protein